MLSVPFARPWLIMWDMEESNVFDSVGSSCVCVRQVTHWWVSADAGFYRFFSWLGVNWVLWTFSWPADCGMLAFVIPSKSEKWNLWPMLG